MRLPPRSPFDPFHEDRLALSAQRAIERKILSLAGRSQAFRTPEERRAGMVHVSQSRRKSVPVTLATLSFLGEGER